MKTAKALGPAIPPSILAARQRASNEAAEPLGGTRRVPPGLGEQLQHVIRFLSGVYPDTHATFAAAVRAGLAKAGYVEGHNLTIE